LAALILEIMGLVAFGAYDCLYSTFPLIPPVIFRNKSTATSLIGYCAMGFLLWCELYHLPLYFEAVKGYNSIIADVAPFPVTLTIAPIAILTGSLISVTGNCYWTVLTSWALCTLGPGLLCLLQVEKSTPAWIFLCIVSGLGFGTGIPTIAVAVQPSVLQNMFPLPSPCQLSPGASGRRSVLQSAVPLSKIVVEQSCCRTRVWPPSQIDIAEMHLTC
jgi:hypothetical protein